jgi:hypothetical protein
VSINWGSWAEVGMAADVGEAHRRRWASQGLNMITPDEGVRMLQDILQRSVSPNVAALPLDTSKLPQSAGRFFERLVRTESKVGPATAVNDGDVLRRLGKAPLSDRPAMLSEFLVDQVVRVLALPSAARARLDVSLMDIGMDSLTAMELRNRVQAALKVRLAVGDLLRGPSISELTMNLLAQLDGADDGGTVPIGTPSSTAQTHDPTSALEAFDF